VSKSRNVSQGGREGPTHVIEANVQIRQGREASEGRQGRNLILCQTELSQGGRRELWADASEVVVRKVDFGERKKCPKRRRDGTPNVVVVQNHSTTGRTLRKSWKGGEIAIRKFQPSKAGTSSKDRCRNGTTKRRVPDGEPDQRRKVRKSGLTQCARHWVRVNYQLK